MTSFHIHISGDYDLITDEVWPDGDAPENPTAADVVAVMLAYGTQRSVLGDWNLDELVVQVDGEVVPW